MTPVETARVRHRLPRRGSAPGRPCARLGEALRHAWLAVALTFGAVPAGLGQPAETAGAPEAIRAAARELVAGAETAYVSDYVSFAGADSIGRVAFALDTNRGRDGGEHQAEHFVAMYDERTGWVDVEGYTGFPNPRGVLLEWPDSPYFEIAGEPYALETLRSAPNGLTLRFGDLVPRVTQRAEGTLFSMASAPATLIWNGRTITGRVVYEHLAMRGANRLSGGLGSALGMLTDGPDFQGLYLTTDDGELYVHRAGNAAATETGGPLMAFWTRAGRSVPVRDLTFAVTSYDAALGFYRWPAAWDARWRSDCGSARLRLETIDHDTQTNWIAGGFGMRFVEGTLGCGDETLETYGFAELIR